MSDIRAIPVDPSRATVEELIDVDQSWLLGATGDYESFAIEAMTRDGRNWQRGIAIRWPARINKTDERVMLRLIISPEDAVGLAGVLTHTARWLDSLAALEGDDT